jgi:hypothetical protein
MNKMIALAIVAAVFAVSTPATADDLPTEVAAGDHYVSLDGSVWEESNGVAGLQRVAGDGFDADTKVAP